ncbi:MAG: prepilin peptidase [Alphaproteobacteria bacterium]|nr:prepilin peptidase [Alphaproteobacteria bacterium]
MNKEWVGGHNTAISWQASHVEHHITGREQGRVIGGELLDRVASADGIGWGALLCAPFVGSFLGVVVRRLPEGRPIGWVRSRCECCGVVLRVRDLVPLYSWFAGGRRCRYCGHRLGWFYPAIELSAVAVALIALAADGGQRTWLDCLLGWWLLALGWIDIRRWLLPDALTLPLVIAGLTATAVVEPEQLSDRALGAALGYLSLRMVSLLYRVLRGREGLGHGDAKLLSASGAWVGAIALPQVVLGAAVSALSAAACLRLAGVRLGAHSALPFGPFLALATWLIWLLGPFFT